MEGLVGTGETFDALLTFHNTGVNGWGELMTGN